MRNALLTFVAIFIYFNSIAQQPFFHSEVTPWVGNIVDVYPDDELLYQVRISNYNQFVIIKQFNDQYKPLKEVLIPYGIDCIRDESGNFYVLIANDFQYDFPLNPVQVTILKYDTDLELIYEKAMAVESTDEWELGKVGKFLQLPNDNLLIVYADKRIVFDTGSIDFTSAANDIYLHKVHKIEIVNESQILIEEGIYSTSFYQANYDGVTQENVILDSPAHWTIFKDHLYTANGSALRVFDLSFNELTSHTVVPNLQNFHRSNTNSLLICSKDEIYEITDETATPTLFFQNDYSKETLIKSFSFSDELGISTFENISDIPHPDHGNITIRKADYIDPNELANIGIEILSSSIIYTDSMEDNSYDWTYWSTVLLEVEIENKGDFPIESIYYITGGNCYQYISRPDYCDKGSKENIDLLPNEKVVVQVFSNLWDWQISIDRTYDICLSILSPNQLYDIDYSDNQSCESITITNTTSVASLPKPIQLSPNPAQDLLQLSFTTDAASDAQLSLFDSQGQLIQTQMHRLEAGQNDQQMNIAHLPPGLYLINIVASDQRFVEKLVKM